MTLPIPPEPRDIKDRIIKRRSVCTGSGCDSFSVWFGNEVARYLWDHWGRELTRIGINWQRFLSILSNHTQELIDWAIRNTLTWNDLMRILANDLSPSTEVTTTSKRGGILDYLG
ncbi:hypothetical protein [Vulcanisaeta sp. JCM 14467]|uniref:hypothetical protein n=1 Tax=Vulcanisaeta sp. JCM 14467 TaxID=1295370 RepID=UPI0006D18A73|nr:hypothetical protein [Vulcanisaeta sp. JCM 14467]